MRQRQQHHFRKAFSLVELLTVMAVMAVLLSIASVGITNMGKAQGLTAGISVSEALFGQARSLAISKGVYTRVVIHGNLNDEDQDDSRRYRKMIMIMEQEIDSETGRTTQNWVSSGQPTFLPDQVYYSAELSSADISNSAEIKEQQHKMGKQESDNVNSYYYEFSPQGICSTPGASFILEAGARPPGSEKVIRGDKRTYGGFVVSRNGNTMGIRDISKIEE